MSTLRVNKVVNLNDDGPVEFTKGISLPSGKTISDESGNNALIINAGVITATSFHGNGENIIGIPGNGVSKGKALALTIIL